MPDALPIRAVQSVSCASAGGGVAGGSYVGTGRPTAAAERSTGLQQGKRLATLEAECARLVALGAVRVRLLLADEENESCMVMQDIEGNEFDLD